MVLGKSMKVDLNQYYKVLNQVNMASDTNVLKNALQGFGVSGEVSVYIGPKESDGEILIPYSVGDGISSVLKFKETGEMVDTVSNAVSKVSAKAAKYFIASMFGESELTTKFDEYEKIVFGGIVSANGCFDSDDVTVCSYEDLKKVPVLLGAKAEEKVAEKKAQEEKEIKDLIANGDKIWAKAELLIKLAQEQNKGIGGIDEEDLIEIYDKHAQFLPTWKPDTIDGAQKYYSSAYDMIVEMLKDPSAYETIEERESDSGCSTTRSHAGYKSKDVCSGIGEKMDCGTKTVEIMNVDVKCDDIDVKVYEADKYTK